MSVNTLEHIKERVRKESGKPSTIYKLKFNTSLLIDKNNKVIDTDFFMIQNSEIFFILYNYKLKATFTIDNSGEHFLYIKTNTPLKELIDDLITKKSMLKDEIDYIDKIMLEISEEAKRIDKVSIKLQTKKKLVKV